MASSVPPCANSSELLQLVKQRVKELGRTIVARRQQHADPPQSGPGDPDLSDSLLTGIFGVLSGASDDVGEESSGLHTRTVTRISRPTFQRAVQKLLGLSLTWDQFNSLFTLIDTNNDGYVQEGEFIDAFGARLAQSGWCHVLVAGTDSRWKKRWSALKGARFLCFRQPQPLLRGDDFTEGPTLINRTSQVPVSDVDINGASVRYVQAPVGVKSLSLEVAKNGTPLLFVHTRSRAESDAWRDALETAAAERGEWIQTLYERLIREVNVRKLSIEQLFASAKPSRDGQLSFRGFLALITELSDEFGLGLSRKQMWTLMQQADGTFSRTVNLAFFTRFFETIFMQRRALLLKQVDALLMRQGASSVEALKAMAQEAAVAALQEQVAQVDTILDEVTLLTEYIDEHFPQRQRQTGAGAAADSEAPQSLSPSPSPVPGGAGGGGGGGAGGGGGGGEDQVPYLPGVHTAMYRRAGLPAASVNASHIASKCQSPRLVVREPPPSNIDADAQAEAEWAVGCSASELVSRRHDQEPCEHCGSFMYVASGNSFDCDSSVFAWEIFAETAGELRLLVLRPAPQTADQFRVVGENVVDVPHRGPHTLSIPLDQQLVVNRGDVIGWTQSAGSRLLRYDHAIDAPEKTIWWGHSEPFRSVVGRSMILEQHEPRSYSLRALCKPNLRRVPDTADPDELVKIVWGAVLDAASFSGQGIPSVLRQFDALDINSDGVVTRSKFEQGLRRVLGLSMSWIQMDLLLRHVGGNGSRIPLQRFLWLLAPPAYERDAAMRAFRALSHVPGQKSTAAAPLAEPDALLTMASSPIRKPKAPQSPRTPRPPPPRPTSARVAPRSRTARPQSAPSNRAKMTLTTTSSGAMELTPLATRVGGGFEWQPHTHVEELTWDQNDSGPWADGNTFERWYSKASSPQREEKRLLRRFKVEYCLAPHVGAQANDQQLVLKEWFNEAPEMDHLLPCAVDGDGNPVQTWYNLGRQGAFSAFNVAIGAFTNPSDFGLSDDGVALLLRSQVVPALERLGFVVQVYWDEEAFAQALDSREPDVAWVMSGSTMSHKQHEFTLTAAAQRERTALVTSCRKFVEAGHGLGMLAGPGSQLHASVIGEVVVNTHMSTSPVPGGGTYINVEQLPHPDCSHPVFTGIHKLFEGSHLTYPDSVGSMSVLVTQHTKPILLVAEPVPSGRLSKTQGRVVMDGGLERVLLHWQSAGTMRLFLNTCVWLTGLEVGASLATQAPKVKAIRKEAAAVRKAIAHKRRLEEQAALSAAAATAEKRGSGGLGKPSTATSATGKSSVRSR